VHDLIDFYKEIGRETSLLADRFHSQTILIQTSYLNFESESALPYCEMLLRVLFHVFPISFFCGMRLFVAMSGSEHQGVINPCVVGLKICGEYKVLALLAETFALWAQNLQVEHKLPTGIV
jgi:hypothetical protein